MLRRVTFAEQDAVMAELMGRYRVSQLSMDQTGMGEKPVEDAKRRYPGRVEGVIFTPQAKPAVASLGKAGFEDRRVRIPAGDLALRGDLHKPKKVVGPTGIPRLIAESDSAGHADRFWAAMLGLAAADPGEYPETRNFHTKRPLRRQLEDDAAKANASTRILTLIPVPVERMDWIGGEERRGG